MTVKKIGKLFMLLVLALVIALAGALLAAKPLEGLARRLELSLREPTVAELTVMEYAEDNGLSYSDYPQSMIELLERNPEAETFVLEYPTYEQQDFDLSEYEDCETVPLFIQWDQRWGYVRYGSDVIGITGCGPTCLAMVGFYLTGDAQFSPDVVAEFSEQEGYYEPGCGSSWTLISEGGVKLGLDVTEIPLVKSRIDRNLEVGNPIICAMGPGDFTTSGHYIVLVGIENGSYRVNDPNSYINSERLWSYEEIEGQIRNLWVIQ